MTEKFLKKCASGSVKEQRVLYDTYAPRLYAVCLRYARDRAMADDMLQEGFIKIFQGLKTYQATGSLEGWLHRVVVNASLELLRRERPYKQGVDLQQVHDISENHPSPIDNLSLQELISLMQQLPDGIREVVNMYIVDGYSHKEISEMLQISEDNSKQRLRRGRQALQQKLITLHESPHETPFE